MLNNKLTAQTLLMGCCLVAGLWACSSINQETLFHTAGFSQSFIEEEPTTALEQPFPGDTTKGANNLHEENRFTKVILGEKLNEPTEMAVLKDGRVLFTERKGTIKLYSPLTKQIKVIGQIPVNTKYNPNQEGKQNDAEDGLLGMAVDPNFEQNHFVYMYFAPEGGDPKDVLCRFVMKGDAIDFASKKVILEVVTQRDECCHTGGSVAFDAKGNIFVSTGDNTNPFASDGYSPSDEQAGRSAWDAQRSAANTNDLRGKILRIHPEPNGTYTIPEGNLFPKGTPNTRPEIYVMGNRNPYRISIDQKTNFLYWGEVGPDANNDTINRGPRGYDEINQARKAGYFGWPYFVGNNKAYLKYDYATKQSSDKLDPAKPINMSPNNTGLKQLPPAQQAFIWYPYAASTEFPLVGSGGRNAMAGPVFYKEDFKTAKRAFPDHYHGKLFTYDWIRGWIMAVTMDKEGNYVSMEPFMPSYRFSNPIDMQFGSDGDLYVLEYGAGWFKHNDDARLVRIEYNGGNRKPVVQMTADKKIGATPLTVHFSSKATKDYDHDNLKYEWSIAAKGGAVQKKLIDPNPTYTFDKRGTYKVILTVTDTKGAKSTAETEIEAGNEPPVLSFELTRGNKTFFFPNQSFDYAVKVHDKEDGSLQNGSIEADQIAVSIDYLKEGFDQVEVAQGHRRADASVNFAIGKNLIDKSDCKACHGIDSKSVGPSYKMVAQKYKDDTGAAIRLANKVIKGGGGVWGENVMSAHPQLTVEQTTQMVNYILSLGNAKAASGGLPATGSYTTILPAEAGDKGALVLRASYTDKGANKIRPLTSEKVLVLKTPNVLATTANQSSGTQKGKMPNTTIELVTAGHSGSFIAFDKIDLNGINQMAFTAYASPGQTAGGKIEVHLDSPNGQLIGESQAITPAVSVDGQATPAQVVKATLKPSTGIHNMYLVFKNDQAPAGQKLFSLLTVHFQHTQL
ncbi:MAG: PQQ-dependent sugar dehydrogenase [Bacteroidota bacterium]